MYRLKSKLKKWLTESLKFIAKIFAIELLKIYILPLFGLISFIGLSLYTKEFLSDVLLFPIIKLPPRLLLGHIIFCLLIISLVIVLWLLIKSFQKHSYYYFLEECGFKWRVTKSSGNVKDFPFCRKHQIELTSDYSYAIGYRGKIYTLYCDICKSVVAKNIKEEELDLCYKRVKRKAEAKYNKYAKGF